MAPKPLPKCHCCGWPTNAANLRVLPDPAQPDSWRIVEHVYTVFGAQLRTHRRGFASEEVALAARREVVG